jgi:hypothetical protein
MLCSLAAADEFVIKGGLSGKLAKHPAWWAGVFGAEPQSKLESLVERDCQELLECAQKKMPLLPLPESVR